MRSNSAILIALLMLLPVFQIQAQDRSPEEDPSPVEIEEITVTAQRTILTLYNQLEAAKIGLYAAYNELNQNDDFDVECRRSDWTHTRIQEQICWPKFATELIAEMFQDSFRGIAGVNGISIAEIENQYSEEFDQLKSSILQVAVENPEVASWLMEVGKLEQDIKRREQECLENPAFQFLFFRLCKVN
ncbi:MAG: hypothetical protein O2861_14020 [Proteobacteria bacterium]|nr:hypothetical protein [Pseudomonadota bacterium]